MDRKAFLGVFQKYASEYDLTDPKILLKYIHTEKVAENCVRIAESLKKEGRIASKEVMGLGGENMWMPMCEITEEDVDLAWQIGVLHDIGRFEQLRRFDTFSDADSINHAEFGADLLFGKREGQIDANLIRRFGMKSENYAIAELAIRCHNRYRIPEELTAREALFCNIIRDADKVDIFRANYETGMEAIYNVTTEELKQSAITPAVLEAFMEGHAVLRSLKRTPIDHLVGHLALTFELVYPESRRIAAEQGFLWKLAEFESENPETREQFGMIRYRIKKELEG